ncbi:transposable element Tc3 transposase [Trichonephila clavipes]|nr:transposable element Tc3 transposase [Trichonephila clavipes]
MKSQVGVKSGDLGGQGEKQGLSHQYAQSAETKVYRLVVNALLVEWLRQQTKLPHLSEANPQVYVETPLHPEKLTVWCALWAGGIIGPYFFKNDEGRNVTVNGDRYRAMITNFFIP